MKNIFISCLCLPFISAVSAQNQAVALPRMHHWAASFSLGTVPLPDTRISIIPGVEYYFTSKFSILSDVTLQLDKNRNMDSTATNKKYMRIKTELRYYFDKSDKWVTPYLSVQFTKAKRSFDVEKSDKYFEKGKIDSAYFYNRASIKSPFVTTTLQMGLSKQIVENLYVDFSLGGGAKFSKTDYTNMSNLRKDKNRELLRLPKSSYRYIGAITTLQLTMGFRLYYRF